MDYNNYKAWILILNHFQLLNGIYFLQLYNYRFVSYAVNDIFTVIYKKCENL